MEWSLLNDMPPAAHLIVRQSKMSYRTSILLAVCFCGGCFSLDESAPHAPAIAVSASTDFNGVYSNQSIYDEKTGGNRRLGLFGHILFDVRFDLFKDADSVRMTASGTALTIEALKDGHVMGSNILQQDRDFTLSPKGITLRDKRENGSDSNHGIPAYMLAHYEKYLRLADDGSLIIEQRDSGMFFFWYVVPVHLARVTETAFRRMQQLPNKAPEPIPTSVTPPANVRQTEGSK